jgi:hypothetical protein
MPGFERVYREKKDQGFEIVALSTDHEGAGKVASYVAQRDVTFPVAMAPAASVQNYRGGNMIQTSILIDRNGRIRHRATARLLAEPLPPIARCTRVPAVP